MAVFYSSEIVKIVDDDIVEGDGGGTTGKTTIVPAVQSVSTSWNYPRRDIGRLGRGSVMPFRQTTQDPIVNLNVDYIPTGSNIEKSLGLLGTDSAIDYLISGGSNYTHNNFKLQIRELVGQGGSVGTINLMSGVITNYNFNASVGDIPRSTFTVECIDVGFDASAEVVPPAINDLHPTLRPQDLNVTLSTGVIGIADSNGMHLQSFSINLPLPRIPLIEIGQRKPFSRELQLPVFATIQMNALVQNFASTDPVSGDSAEQARLTAGKFIDDDIVIEVLQPQDDGSTSSQSLIKYVLRRPYLEDVNISNSVGGYTSLDLQFSVPIAFDNPDVESTFIISGFLS